MSYINPYKKTNVSFLLRLTSYAGIIDIISDSSGNNIYAVAKYNDTNNNTGNIIWKLTSELTTIPTPLSTTTFLNQGSNAYTNRFLLYNNQFLITLEKSNSRIVWWDFTFPMSSTTYRYLNVNLGNISGTAINGNYVYFLQQSTLKVYKSQLTISNNTLSVSAPQLAGGGSDTNAVNPVPTFPTTSIPAINCAHNSGHMIFDNVGALYITTVSNGVYKYNSGFTSADTPVNIIPYYNCSLNNIVYSNTYNLLYVSNLSNLSIDLFSTSGQLVISSYIGNTLAAVPNAHTGNGLGNGIVSMVFDNMNTLYYQGYATKSLVSYGDVYMIYKIVCFKKDTQILTLTGYKLIQDLRKGDLVQTLKHGYVPIYKIGFSEMEHPCVEERVKEQLYKCSPDNYPEVFEDLVLTGCHSILVDSIKSEEQLEQIIEVNGRLCSTDDKYRLPVCVDERSTVYEVAGKHTIYHMALEHDDYFMNYGIYANGLLVESTSKRFMDTIKMTLAE
jgi:hypothetical protein